LACQRGLAEVSMYLRISALGPRFDLGDWDRLLQTAEEVRTWAEIHGVEYLRLWAEFRQAEVLVHRGKRARAAALAARFLPGVRAIGELETVAPALTVAAQVKHAQGRPVAAGRLLDELSTATNGRSVWQWANQLPRPCPPVRSDRTLPACRRPCWPRPTTGRPPPSRAAHRAGRHRRGIRRPGSGGASLPPSGDPVGGLRSPVRARAGAARPGPLPAPAPTRGTASPSGSSGSVHPIGRPAPPSRDRPAAQPARS
jgi:hypothetical protein